MTTLTAPPTKRKVRLSPHARRVVRDYLVQRITGTVYEYEYALHYQDARLVMVRIVTDKPLAPRGRHQDWQVWGCMYSAESAAIALASLRMAQAREGVEAREWYERNTV